MVKFTTFVLTVRDYTVLYHFTGTELYGYCLSQQQQMTIRIYDHYKVWGGRVEVMWVDAWEKLQLRSNKIASSLSWVIVYNNWIYFNCIHMQSLFDHKRSLQLGCCHLCSHWSVIYLTTLSMIDMQHHWILKEQGKCLCCVLRINCAHSIWSIAKFSTSITVGVAMQL